MTSLSSKDRKDSSPSTNPERSSSIDPDSIDLMREEDLESRSGPEDGYATRLGLAGKNEDMDRWASNAEIGAKN